MWPVLPKRKEYTLPDLLTSATATRLYVCPKIHTQKPHFMLANVTLGLAFNVSIRGKGYPQ
jgi:hypothetical protein